MEEVDETEAVHLRSICHVSCMAIVKSQAKPQVIYTSTKSEKSLLFALQQNGERWLRFCFMELFRSLSMTLINCTVKVVGGNIFRDDIWKYVGKLTEVQRSMIDDRFKWKAREMDKRKEGKPGGARAALRRFVRENG